MEMVVTKLALYKHFLARNWRGCKVKVRTYIDPSPLFGLEPEPFTSKAPAKQYLKGTQD
jgi:hypothetical protein